MAQAPPINVYYPVFNESRQDSIQAFVRGVVPNYRSHSAISVLTTGPPEENIAETIQAKTPVVGKQLISSSTTTDAIDMNNGLVPVRPDRGGLHFVSKMLKSTPNNLALDDKDHDEDQEDGFYQSVAPPSKLQWISAVVASTLGSTIVAACLVALDALVIQYFYHNVLLSPAYATATFYDRIALTIMALISIAVPHWVCLKLDHYIGRRVNRVLARTIKDANAPLYANHVVVAPNYDLNFTDSMSDGWKWFSINVLSPTIFTTHMAKLTRRMSLTLVQICAILLSFYISYVMVLSLDSVPIVPYPSSDSVLLGVGGYMRNAALEYLGGASSVPATPTAAAAAAAATAAPAHDYGTAYDIFSNGRY